MDLKEKLESVAKNSICLRIGNKAGYMIGATRFGGKPDVPPNFTWPTYKGKSYSDKEEKERPLSFLAQFNLEDIAKYDKDHLLPIRGYYHSSMILIHSALASILRMKALPEYSGLRIYHI